MISVVILTKNEEQDLPSCLSSLRWCDDVHVLDSGSTDKTLEVAQNYNAQICTNPFKSFGHQRNFALENLFFKYDWILFLDADEVITTAFKRAITKATMEASNNIAGFYCCCKMMLEDRWLKYCDNFPKWQFRLVRKGRANFTDFGHGQKEGLVDGQLGYISEPYLHYSFSKGWTQWIERHNKYSSLEAKARFENRPKLNQFLSLHSSIRNPVLKSWLSRIPGWPLIRFIYSYIFNLGFLEGAPGFIYCTNMAYHEFLIQIKMRELKLIERKKETLTKDLALLNNRIKAQKKLQPKT